MTDWSTFMVIVVRNLIDDTDITDQVYTDDRLQELILVSCQMLRFDTDLAANYTIDLDNLTLTPDPTNSPMDNSFITLVCLKAAAILTTAEAKLAADQAILAKDGSSSIDSRNVSPAKLAIAKNLQESFKEALFKYQTSGSVGMGRMIVSPFRLASTPYGYDGYFPIHNH